MSASRPRRVTQVDVAKLAGVTQATVSHVIAGERGERPRASDDTRRRVLDAIASTGYVMDPIAQRLAGGRSGFVGVFTYEPVFPQEGDNFYHAFFVGIEQEAERVGWNLILYTGIPVENGRRRLVGDSARQLQLADGCVLLGLHYDARDLEELLKLRFPFVFLGRRESPNGVVPYVAADYYTATREVIAQLGALGHERIGYIGDLRSEQINAERLLAYRERRAETGHPAVLIEGGETDVAKVLRQVRDAGLTAVVTDNTGIAERLRLEALTEGLRVPGDLSIVQLGDPEFSVDDDVEWSGFRIPREEMGAESLHVLADIFAGRTEAADLQRMLPCTVIEGATSGPIAPPREPTGHRPNDRSTSV